MTWTMRGFSVSYDINCKDIYLYAVPSEEEVTFLCKIHTADVVFDIIADGTRLLTGHKGGNDLSVWDIPGGTLLYTRKTKDTKTEGIFSEGARFTESRDILCDLISTRCPNVCYHLAVSRCYHAV